MIRKAIVLLTLFLTPLLLVPQSTVGTVGSSGQGYGQSVTGSTTIYTPAQLGANALTEPGSSTSALTNIIDTRGVKQAVLHYNCTQGAISVNIQTYAEDGVTTLALVTPVTATAAATAAFITIGSESNPAINTGTLATPPAGVVRFPQRALAFSFTNASVTAGTCTARLYVNY